MLYAKGKIVCVFHLRAGHVNRIYTTEACQFLFHCDQFKLKTSANEFEERNANG